MSAPNWNDLLPSVGQIDAMSPERLERATEAASQYGINLGFGIAAIGHLLACTASNGETGLSERVATDIGWLLETLGTLSANLADTGDALDYRRNQLPRA
jgi:hypothetical protein